MSYYIDKELESQILVSMVHISNDEVKELYEEIKTESPPQQCLSSASRGKTYEQMTYKQLHYIVIGSKNISADSRANANVILVHMLLSDKKINRFLTNESMLQKFRLEVKAKYGSTTSAGPKEDEPIVDVVKSKISATEQSVGSICKACGKDEGGGFFGCKCKPLNT